MKQTTPPPIPKSEGAGRQRLGASLGEIRREARLAWLSGHRWPFVVAAIAAFVVVVSAGALGFVAGRSGDRATASPARDGWLPTSSDETGAGPGETAHLAAVLAEIERITASESLETETAEAEAAEEAHGAALVPRDAVEFRAAIVSRLALIERRLGDDGAAANDAAEERKPLVTKTELERLRRRAGEADAARAEATRLGADKAQVEEELAQTKAEVDELRQLSDELQESAGAFVMALTRGELGAMRGRDYLRRRGLTSAVYEPTSEILGVGGTGKTIVAVDPTAEVLYLGERVSSARVLSIHRRYEDQYEIRRRSGQLSVVIDDPVAFWRISRYLILEVE